MKELFWIAAYTLLISVLAAALTCYDKWAARKRPKHRIRERTLLFTALLGGSASMLICMLLIRHKTKHAKFMIGIPFIILLQLCICLLLIYFF